MLVILNSHVRREWTYSSFIKKCSNRSKVCLALISPQPSFQQPSYTWKNMRNFKGLAALVSYVTASKLSPHTLWICLICSNSKTLQEIFDKPILKGKYSLGNTHEYTCTYHEQKIHPILHRCFAASAGYLFLYPDLGQPCPETLPLLEKCQSTTRETQECFLKKIMFEDTRIQRWKYMSGSANYKTHTEPVIAPPPKWCANEGWRHWACTKCTPNPLSRYDTVWKVLRSRAIHSQKPAGLPEKGLDSVHSTAF